MMIIITIMPNMHLKVATGRGSLEIFNKLLRIVRAIIVGYYNGELPEKCAQCLDIFKNSGQILPAISDGCAYDARRLGGRSRSHYYF